jgi:hypothetical protein
VIIVSESSAEAARSVRTRRYTPRRRYNSAPHNDTPAYANARLISVHTEDVSAIIQVDLAVFVALDRPIAATERPFLHGKIAIDPGPR